MSSSRLPGKPLRMIGDKTMIQRVYEGCKRSDAFDVYVATDSQEIYDHVSIFGKCILTPEFENGTQRVCFAVNKIEEQFDYFINVQGDEPFISDHFLNAFIRNMHSLRQGTILTGASVLKENQLLDRNAVKLVSDNDGGVICFTRSPFFGRTKNILKHVGIYGFSFDDLAKIQNILPTEESKSSSLEQIAWMENGFSIKYAMCYRNSVCVDTPGDLDLARKMVLLGEIP